MYSCHGSTCKFTKSSLVWETKKILNYSDFTLKLLVSIRVLYGCTAWSNLHFGRIPMVALWRTERCGGGNIKDVDSLKAEIISGAVRIVQMRCGMARIRGEAVG